MILSPSRAAIGRWLAYRTDPGTLFFFHSSFWFYLVPYEFPCQFSALNTTLQSSAAVTPVGTVGPGVARAQ